MTDVVLQCEDEPQLVVGPCRTELNPSGISTFSASLAQDGITHVIDPKQNAVRIPLVGMGFADLHNAVARCLDARQGNYQQRVA